MWPSSWKSSSLILLVLFAPLGVMAQTGPSSNVAQCIPQYDWSISASGQTPCLLAAILESACGTNTSVNALPIGQMYQGPTEVEQTPCKCSSVTYILMSACAGCQDRDFVNWTTWCAHCTNGLFRETWPTQIAPLPSSIQVPNWAFMNVTTYGAFDPVLAQQMALGTPASTTGPPTSSTTVLPASTSLNVTSSSPTTSAPASAQAASGKSHTNVGPIVGGVIGGVVFGIAAVVITWILCCRRKRKQEEQEETKQQVVDPSYEIVNPFVPSPVSETFSSPSSSPQALLFDHERIAAGARPARKFSRSRGTINRHPAEISQSEKYEAPPQYDS